MSGKYQASWETYKYFMSSLVLTRPLQDKGLRMSCWWHRMEKKMYPRNYTSIEIIIGECMSMIHLWMYGEFLVVKGTRLVVTMWLMRRSGYSNTMLQPYIYHFTSISKVGSDCAINSTLSLLQNSSIKVEYLFFKGMEMEKDGWTGKLVRDEILEHVHPCVPCGQHDQPASRYFYHSLKGHKGLDSSLDSVLQSDSSTYFATKSSEDPKKS